MIYNNRPSDKREEREEKVYDLLERLGIEFLRADHAPANTVDDCKSVEEELGVKICKNLFLCNRQETVFYLLLMEGEKRFVTKDFSKSIGVSRLSFASEENLLKYLNVKPGSASILGLMYDEEKKVNVYIDKDVAEAEYIGCHPCKNTSSLKIKTDDIMDKFLPYINVNSTVVEIKPLKEQAE